MKKILSLLLFSSLFIAIPKLSHADAACNIGKILYDKGQYAKSFKHMKKLARYKNGCAKYYLGLMYFKGEGTNKNLDLAVKFIKESAKEGYTDAVGFFDRQE